MKASSKAPLTSRKKNWVKNRKTTIRGTKLAYNAAQQERYVKSLQFLVQSMVDETKREITKLFKSTTSKEYFTEQKEAASIVAQDESISSQARILTNKLMKKFSSLFAKKSVTIAERMLKGALQASKTSLHSSLETLSGGLSLKTGVIPKGLEDVSKALLDENVSLIKSIPQEYFKNITGSVMRSITTGQGLKDLTPDIEKYDGQTKRRAKNLALDQTRKAYNSINKQRCIALNVKKMEWLHSGGGQQPRESHQKIDGVIDFFDFKY